MTWRRQFTQRTHKRRSWVTSVKYHQKGRLQDRRTTLRVKCRPRIGLFGKQSFKMFTPDFSSALHDYPKISSRKALYLALCLQPSILKIMNYLIFRVLWKRQQVNICSMTLFIFFPLLCRNMGKWISCASKQSHGLAKTTVFVGRLFEWTHYKNRKAVLRANCVVHTFQSFCRTVPVVTYSIFKY